MRYIIKFMAGLMLALVAVLPMQAQTENQAFYIYQNDGHFDGFFYDEVEKMAFSFLDTLGVEHDKIVSQEIVTADSTYRIMLSAIDSIGFVQPEIELRSNVRDVREEGMLEYVSYNDEEKMEMAFYLSTSEQMLPRVGDVLVDFDMNEGFSGRVTKVVRGSSLIYVYYEPIESIKDIFQRFVCVEQIDHDNAGNMVRRRVAGAPGLNKGEWGKTKRASATFDFRLLNMDFSGHIPVVADDDLTVSLDINTHVAMSLKGSYNINLIDPIYIGLTFTSDLAFALGFTIDGKIATIVDKSSDFIPGLPIPAAAPIFELRNIPGLFARGEAHLKFSAGLVNLAGAKVWHKLEFNDDWIPSLTYGRLAGEGEAEQPGTNHMDQYVEFNGFVQAGLHAPLTLSTNRWLSSFFKAEIGTHLYIGPKLSGAIQVNFADMMRDGPSVYNALKNTALTLTPLSVDFETKAKTKGFLGGESEFTFGEGSISVLKDYSLYLLPEFDSWKEEHDPQTKAGYVRSGTYIGLVCKDRATLFPYQIGLRMFRKTTDNDYEPIGDVWNGDWIDGSLEWHYGDEWLKSTNMLDHPYLNTSNIGQPGEHRLRPIFKLGDMVFEGAPDYYCWLGDYFRVKPTTIETSNKVGDEVSLSVETNMELGDTMDNLYLKVGKYEGMDYTVQYGARYNRKDNNTGELTIKNLKTNIDPFHEYVSKCDEIWESGLGLMRTINITTPITIVQAPNTNAKFNGLYIAGKGEGFYYYFEGDTISISMNNGEFSFTHKDTHTYGTGPRDCKITGKLSPDEKGWGWFRISGNFEINKQSNQNFPGLTGSSQNILLYKKEKTNASFSGRLKLTYTNSLVARLESDGDFSFNGTTTETIYDYEAGEYDYSTGKYNIITKTTTNTYTCNEGDTIEMKLDIKDNGY